MRSVPNVPNTDWLEVYWDGQDYTSMPSTVTDKTGNGVTGTPNGGVGFDTEYKAFTFDGVDDYISGTLPISVSGDWVHSMSMWFKADSFTTANDSNTLFYGGGSSVSASCDQASTTVLLRLNVGDTISVKVNGDTVHSAYNSFVGEYFSSL